MVLSRILLGLCLALGLAKAQLTACNDTIASPITGNWTVPNGTCLNSDVRVTDTVHVVGVTLTVMESARIVAAFAVFQSSTIVFRIVDEVPAVTSFTIFDVSAGSCTCEDVDVIVEYPANFCQNITGTMSAGIITLSIDTDQCNIFAAFLAHEAKWMLVGGAIYLAVFLVAVVIIGCYMSKHPVMVRREGFSHGWWLYPLTIALCLAKGWSLILFMFGVEGSDSSLKQLDIESALQWFLRVNTVLNCLVELFIAGLALIRIHNIATNYKQKQLFQIVFMILIHIFFFAQNINIGAYCYATYANLFPNDTSADNTTQDSSSSSFSGSSSGQCLDEYCRNGRVCGEEGFCVDPPLSQSTDVWPIIFPTFDAVLLLVHLIDLFLTYRRGEDVKDFARQIYSAKSMRQLGYSMNEEKMRKALEKGEAKKERKRSKKEKQSSSTHSTGSSGGGAQMMGAYPQPSSSPSSSPSASPGFADPPSFSNSGSNSASQSS